jgi:hypothetical protein
MRNTPIGGVRIPDSKLAQAATELVRDTESDLLFHLSTRVYHNYGRPEVLQYEDTPRPIPGPGELLIKVDAASVNPVDWKTRAGYMKDLFPHTLPFKSLLWKIMLPVIGMIGFVIALGLLGLFLMPDSNGSYTALSLSDRVRVAVLADQ